MRIESVLIDRDGTVIAERDYLSDPAQVELLPGAAEALSRFARAGARLFLVTNQSGIGRGYFGLEDFQATQRRLEELLAQGGVALDGVAFCPHAPDDGCACRKPSTGMWEELRRRHGLSPETTAMIGDNASDAAFGRACGLAESVLVLTGHGKAFAKGLGLPDSLDASPGWARVASPAPGQPTALARDLASAADLLLQPGR